MSVHEYATRLKAANYQQDQALIQSAGNNGNIYTRELLQTEEDLGRGQFYMVESSFRQNLRKAAYFGIGALALIGTYLAYKAFSAEFTSGYNIAKDSIGTLNEKISDYPNTGCALKVVDAGNQLINLAFSACYDFCAGK